MGARQILEKECYDDLTNFGSCGTVTIDLVRPNRHIYLAGACCDIDKVRIVSRGKMGKQNLLRHRSVDGHPW